jgi:hypothetical protein
LVVFAAEHSAFKVGRRLSWRRQGSISARNCQHSPRAGRVETAAARQRGRSPAQSLDAPEHGDTMTLSAEDLLSVLSTISVAEPSATPSLCLGGLLSC